MTTVTAKLRHAAYTGAMRGLIIITAVLAAAGCASSPKQEPGARLAGQELDTVVGLYGPWAERLVLEGRPTYVWRRRYQADARTYACELRVELGFRSLIGRTTMQGMPQACALFARSG